MGKEVDVPLDTNDKFPELELQLVSGESVDLYEATGKGYGIVLFYRGSW
jgi:peroxiredoxin